MPETYVIKYQTSKESSLWTYYTASRKKGEPNWTSDNVSKIKQYDTKEKALKALERTIHPYNCSIITYDNALKEIASVFTFKHYFMDDMDFWEDDF